MAQLLFDSASTFSMLLLLFSVVWYILQSHTFRLSMDSVTGWRLVTLCTNINEDVLTNMPVTSDRYK